MNENLIKWTMTNPPVVPARWRIWQKKNIQELAGDAAEIDLQRPALWLTDPLISRILENALQERLPRSTGWEAADDLSEPVKERLRLAASVYKRGVAFRTARGSWDTTATNGIYPIQIVSERKAFAPLLTDEHFVVVDRKVHASHQQIFAGKGDLLVIAADEHDKQPATVVRIIKAWEQAGKPPHWSIFGGGIITDTAAFAASLSGCKSTFVPTTLLAMADACVGGKTGVNFHPYGKNLLGHFYFPSRVIAWPGWLKTLDRRQISAGAFECIKHFFLQNDIDAARQFAIAARDLDLAAIASFLPQVIQVKADVVAGDPAETGRRAILNFGHTIGHAVEALSQELTTGDDTILHGEAVGIGMAFALYLSDRIAGLGKKGTKERTDILRTSGGLPTRAQIAAFFRGRDPSADDVVRKLAGYISQDKKAGNDGDITEWVLLTKDGNLNSPEDGRWLTPVPMADFPARWREFLHDY